MTTITFGNYPQNADLPEPIEWRVLDTIDGKTLLVSKYLLDVHRFDTRSNDWTSSEIRSWLNNMFLKTAFSVKEQKRLEAYEGDRVTLLSLDEVKKYFSYRVERDTCYEFYPDRVAIPTAYAKKNGAYSALPLDVGLWWLRSPGYVDSNASIVNSHGYLSKVGSNVRNTPFCVRPVIFLN